jgi:predicted extracellular nuclease
MSLASTLRNPNRQAVLSSDQVDGRLERGLAAVVLSAVLVLAGCGQEGRTQTSGAAAATGAGSTAGSGGAGSASGTGTGGASPGLKILNWNTHNTFNDQDDSDSPDEEIVPTQEYAAHRAALVTVLAAMDPDIAVLQEIENMAVLEDMNQDLGGVYAAAVLFDTNDLRGIDIGILTKITPDETKSHQTDTLPSLTIPGQTYSYVRDALEVSISYQGQRVVLLGVHYRSKGPPDDADRRLAEAAHTRAIADGIAAVDPAAGIVILGDFNDLPGSPPLVATEGTAPDRYTDAADFVMPPEDKWTFNYMGNLELIDHQMSNPVLAARLDKQSVVIRHAADVSAAGDHAPMMATYLFE